MPLKKILNQQEDATHQRLQEVCEQYGASVFAKVRLADVLPIENSGISDIEYRFALQSHFDFIVCDSVHIPLFAVEFDGLTHESETQKDRDQKKVSLCERFDLPLLRINSKYLSRQYRDYDLLTWFVEVWFLQRAFDQAQAAGSISFDEPFDPMMFIHLPGRKNRFPLWLSAPLGVKIQRLREAGKCADWFPSKWMGRDERGNIHGLSWIGIDDNYGVFAQTGIRSQKFPVIFIIDLLSELLIFQIYEELTLVLEGKTRPIPKSEFETILTEFKTRFHIFLSTPTST